MITKGVCTLGRLWTTTWLLIFAIAALLVFESIEILIAVAAVVLQYSGLADSRMPLSLRLCLLIIIFCTPDRRLLRYLRVHVRTRT